MSNKPIRGDEKADPETLEIIRSSPYNFPDTRWAVYQNHDLGHPELGRLTFLAVGPRNTCKTAPERMPDTAQGYRMAVFARRLAQPGERRD